MNRPTSDERYYRNPTPDPLTPHKVLHVSLGLAYIASLFVSWALDFHPFRQSLHGWLMVLAAFALALAAFGPMHNIRLGTSAEQARKLYMYRRYTSWIVGLISVGVLIILWVVALYEQSHGALLG